MRKLGVIGGLGPMATAYFLQLVTQMSDAGNDQEHMEILLHSKPQIPDRTRYILGESGESPLPQMTEIGIDLKSQGAELIAIPCVTAHYFQRRLEEAIGIPIVDTIQETAVCLEEAGVGSVGIMATDGTIASGLFQKAFAERRMQCILPDRIGQRAIMELIYRDIKAGREVELPLFRQVAEDLFRRGAQVVLLGCTELSLVKRDFPLGTGFLDVLEVLAQRAVLFCGRLKQEYTCLITR